MLFPISKVSQTIALAAFFGLTISSHAAAVLYWEFDGSTTNTVNAGASLNGTASAHQTGGSAPTYSTTVPGAIITAGVGGAVVNQSNTNSFSFVNAGLPGSTTSQTGGIVYTSNAGLAVTTTSNFTVEAFVNTSSLAGFSTIFNMNNSLGVAWMLDTTGTGQLRIRTDTATTGNQSPNIPTTSPVITDSTWHHVAVTYNGSSFTVYLDYVAVITGFDPAGDVLFNGTNFNVGASTGRAFNGLIDEVRFSGNVLSTNDFLRAIPEPTAAFLSAVGLLGLLRRKRD